MLHHRFRELVEALPSNTTVAVGSSCAFVPCPVFAVMPVAQLAWVQEVYRIAAEQTRQQMTPPRRRSRMPEFSRN